jgi:hypothetical protein
MSRDDIIRQVPSLQQVFPTYKDFARARISDLFPAARLKDALVYHATQFASCYLENKGNGQFSLHPLPAMAQIAPLNGMVADDYNGDGNLDVALCGNDFGNQVLNGRYDAMNGLVLLGDGKGNFSAQTIARSGFYVPGDAKALVKLRSAAGNYLLAASRNRGPLSLFRSRSQEKPIPLGPDDRFVRYTLSNGKSRKEELYFGSSFLSQSARFISAGAGVKKIEIVDRKGRSRLWQQSDPGK